MQAEQSLHTLAIQLFIYYQQVARNRIIVHGRFVGYLIQRLSNQVDCLFEWLRTNTANLAAALANLSVYIYQRSLAASLKLVSFVGSCVATANARYRRGKVSSRRSRQPQRCLAIIGGIVLLAIVVLLWSDSTTLKDTSDGGPVPFLSSKQLRDKLNLLSTWRSGVLESCIDIRWNKNIPDALSTLRSVAEDVRDIPYEQYLADDDIPKDDWAETLQVLVDFDSHAPKATQKRWAYSFCSDHAMPFFRESFFESDTSFEDTTPNELPMQLDSDDGHSHYQFNPSEAVTLALTEGVRMNNEGHRLMGLGRFAKAKSFFTRAMHLKQAAFPMDSVHMCIAYSGLAEVDLAWGKADGDLEKLDTAEDSANELLRIAKRIGHHDNQRIAREILADIAVARQRLTLK